MKLAFVLMGGVVGVVAAVVGLLPLWTIAVLGAGGLLTWGVVEYLSDRPPVSGTG